MSDDVDVQPSGERIETTLAVVANILTDAAFAKEVVAHNGWDEVDIPPLSQQDVAILFLASRYQWAVNLLSRQTTTLKAQVDGLLSRVDSLEDRVFDRGEE